MNRKKQRERNKWKWMLAGTGLLVILFCALFMVKGRDVIHAADPAEITITDGRGNAYTNGSTCQMRRRVDTFKASYSGSGLTTYTWSIGDTSVLEKDPSCSYNAAEFKVKAKKPDRTSLTVRVVNASENIDVMISIYVDVKLAVNEYLSDEDGTSAKAAKAKIVQVKRGAQEKASLVMEYGTGKMLQFGKDAGTEPGNLNFTFGSALISDGTQTGDGYYPGRTVEWTSGDDDVIKVSENEGNKGIMATGAGNTTLRARITDGDDTQDVEIEVYVVPKVLVDGSEPQPNATKKMYNLDPIGIDSLTTTGLHGIYDRVNWVITDVEGGGKDFVSDSKGNGDHAKATLEWMGTNFRLKAKAGQYEIRFYAGDSYPGKDAYQNEALSPDSNVMRAFQADVQCNYESTKSVHLGVGGQYSLPEALNISKDILLNDHKFRIDISGIDRAVLEQDPSNLSLFKAIGRGSTAFTVTREITAGSYHGWIAGKSMTIKITVDESFALSSAELNMAVGSKVNLWAVFGSEQPDLAGSSFLWTSSDTRKVSVTPAGQSAEVEAISSTNGTKVEVSLQWTDSNGLTQVAICKITVSDAVSPLNLDHTTLTINSGDTKMLRVTNAGTFDDVSGFVWISSDTNIVRVEAQATKSVANVIAGTKTGTAMVTVINTSNNVSATCIVTVTQSITSLAIDKGTNYTVSLSQGFVQLKAVYQPKTATSTQFSWSSSDTSIAKVDDKGMVTLLKAGQATITVVTNNNEPYLTASCTLNVETTQIEKITVKETTINMAKGDKYTVVPVLTPANPTDSTLTWIVKDTKIAKVDKGVITATAAGQTTLTITGGKAQPVTLIINVREKISSIAFDEVEKKIPVGGKTVLKVTVRPDIKNLSADALKFRSLDTTVATVSAKGEVVGVKEGTTYIMCSSSDLGPDKAIYCKIIVGNTGDDNTKSFTINPTSQTIKVGQKFRIVATFQADDKGDREISYESVDDSIVSVDENGIVTGESVGISVIRCTRVETDEVQECTVTVDDSVTFSLSPATRTLVRGESFTPKKITVPANANKSATWKSSNSAIATVNSAGKITGKKNGTCTITCTLTRYKQSATCKVKVTSLKTSLKLNKTNIRINLGQTYTLKPKVTTNSNTKPSVKWTSKNKKIATVGSKSGRVTGKRLGSTYIIAKTTDKAHATAKCRVTVIRRATGISLNKKYVVTFVGRSVKLRATVKPGNATIKKVKWSSSKSSIARVTGSGIVTGIAPGEVDIKVKTTDGSNKSATCHVKVLEATPATSIEVSQRDITMKKGDTTRLSYYVLPKDNSDSIKFASDNKRVAVVSKKGNIRAVGTGNATITIMSSSGVTATVNVNVVAMNKTSIVMRQYDTETLIVMGTGFGANITWYSSNNRIATVTGGKVTGKAPGVAEIYAYINGCRVSCHVTIVSVNQKP